MKIGYVLKKFPKLSETFVLNEILALEEQGAEVEIFSLGVADEPRFHAAVGRLRAEIHYLGAAPHAVVATRIASLRATLAAPGAGDWRGVWDLLELPDRDPVRLVRSALELAALARERGVERLHAHFAGTSTEVARAAALLLDLPYSFTCHAKDIYHDSVDRVLLARSIRDAERVITVCDANRAHLEGLFAQPLTNLQRLYNGIDTARFRPELHRPTTPPVVLGVGRLVEKKGFVHLVEAIAALVREGRPVQCVIAGEGRERERIEAAILAHGLTGRVRLLGAVDTDEVALQLTRATVLALPCVIGEDGNRDALPTVILEAMAAGVPVVSTPVAGVSEMLDGGAAGSLVPIADVPALASAIAALLDDPMHARRIAQRARERVERHFDLRRNAGLLLEGFLASTSTAQEMSA